MAAISEAFSQDDIAVIQNRQLRKTVHYAYSRSPFYRDLMDREGLAPSDIKSLQDLRHLPTTSKDDMAREGERFLCVRPEDVADIMTTAGATGRPLFTYATEADMNRLAYNEQLSFRVAGLTARDTVVVAVTVDRCFLSGVATYLGLRRLGAASVRMGQGSPASLLAMLEKTQATAVVSVPSFLKRVAGYAETVGFPLRRQAVDKLVCIGEPIRDAEFRLNPLGQFLERAWRARIHASYTGTEFAVSCCECEAGRGGHVHPELMHVEIVDDQGRVQPPGVTGEVCVTPFGVTGMPLLRYRTGDYAFIESGPCACGRVTDRLGPVLGRRALALTVGGVRVYPGSLHVLVEADPDVIGHVLVVERDDAASDRLSFLLDVRHPQAVDRLRAQLQDLLKTTPEIRVVDRERMRRLQRHQGGRGPRRFIDRRGG